MERTIEEYFELFTKKHWDRLQQVLQLTDLQAETLIKDKFIEAGYTEDNGYTIVFETTPSEENNEENGSSEVIGSSEEN